MTEEELKFLIQKAEDTFNRLTPAQQAVYREAQRRSWCIGELMLQNPRMSRKRANEIYDKALKP